MAKQNGKHQDSALAQNRKARHDYAVEETYEAGIALTGTEIKSVRDRRVNIKDGYVQIRNGEAIMMNVHISPFAEGNRFNVDPLRNRKLLLHKKEIKKLGEATTTKGVTIIPLKMYRW